MTLKELREKTGMSQAELSAVVGLNQSTISQYENGSRMPPMTKAKKIADALGVTLDDFFCSLTFHNEI